MTSGSTGWDGTSIHAFESKKLFSAKKRQHLITKCCLFIYSQSINTLIDIPPQFDYPYSRPGRPGAAEPFKPRQGRETATVRKCLWVPPVTCPDILSMTSKRWLFIILALVAGVGIGLAYGWVIDPVDFFDLTPDTLRADYKADYVLMTAEAYRVEQDPGLAARRLAIFGTQSPSTIAAEGLDYARANGFSDSDIALIQELVTALQAWSGIR